jgi:hypothetical protein
MADKHSLKRIEKSKVSGDIREHIPMVGILITEPKVGGHINLMCDPVVEGAVGRLINTSRIVAHDGGNEYVTESGSVYELKEI